MNTRFYNAYNELDVFLEWGWGEKKVLFVRNYLKIYSSKEKTEIIIL